MVDINFNDVDEIYLMKLRKMYYPFVEMLMSVYHATAYQKFNLPSKEIESMGISSVGWELGIIAIFSI